MRLGSLALPVALGALAALFASSDADACGGCFPQSGATAFAVTSHRMAVAVSARATVFWDQVQFAGNPTDFAWVMPVAPGSRFELSTAAWMETLDAATGTNILPASQRPCGGFVGGTDFVSPSGCSCGPKPVTDSPASRNGGVTAVSGSSSSGGVFGPPPVQVVRQNVVGPYEETTLHANQPGVLAGWLKSHGYAVDPSLAPTLDAYAMEGLDFIAIRLKPDAGVSDMRPVRVVSPAGTKPTLPLRMLAAGAPETTRVTLYVLAEERESTPSFPTQIIDANRVVWDFTASTSNYADVLRQTFGANQGRTLVASYAEPGALFEPLRLDVLGMTPMSYMTSLGQTATTIADLYLAAATESGELDDPSCQQTIALLESGTQSPDTEIVETCPPSGGEGGGGTGGSGGGGGATGVGGTGGAGGGAGGCVAPDPNQIAASSLACGHADDLRAAMNGLHPSKVWISRFDAGLPKSALVTDLALGAAKSQEPVHSTWQAGSSINGTCGTFAGAELNAPPAGRSSPRDRDGAALGALALAFATTLARRAVRARRRVVT